MDVGRDRPHNLNRLGTKIHRAMYDYRDVCFTLCKTGIIFRYEIVYLLEPLDRFDLIIV